MGRLIIVGILLIQLSGCTVLSAVLAIPSAIFDGFTGAFTSSEKILPTSMSVSLAAVQRGLMYADMEVDLLESKDGNYIVAFGNYKLDGWMEISRQTSRLTSVYVKVRNGMLRERGIEATVLDVIHENALKLGENDTFDFTTYGEVKREPSAASECIGWYRHGGLLNVKASADAAWQVVSMPSGGEGYLPSSELAEKSEVR